MDNLFRDPLFHDRSEYRGGSCYLADYNRYSFSIPLDYYDPSSYTPYGLCENDAETPFYRTACLVEPSFWISSAPIRTAANGYMPDNWNQLSDAEQKAINYEYNNIYLPAFQEKFNVEEYDNGVEVLTPFEHYQSRGQEGNSAFSVGFYENGELFDCTDPMLDTQDVNPTIKSLDPDPEICGHLKTAGSQASLINNGFGYVDTGWPSYIIIDNYRLFRRDFYGESRYGSDVSVGAFQ